MSFIVTTEQLLGGPLSDVRKISSDRFNDVFANTYTPKNLIKFFNDYPTSAIDNNPMTRWAMYANTPLSQQTKESLYPALKRAIQHFNW